MNEAKPPSVSAFLEREVKLAVEQRFRLPDLGGKPLPTRVLTSTYYDTADFRLAYGGMTLRRRVEQGASVWQLKLPADKARRELEVKAGPGSPPQVLTDLLMAHVRAASLTEVAKLRTWRKGVRVQAGEGTLADVVLDVVRVLHDRHVIRRFREIEIELVQGDDAGFQDLEAQLRKAGAWDHDGRPKLFRALDLPLPPVPEPPAPEAPTVDHLCFMVTRQVDTLLAHDPGVRLGGVPDDVHQMRVAVRRLRAILRAARPVLHSAWSEPLSVELAWVGQLLGGARDLDVQMASFEREAETLDRRDRTPLIRFVRRLRKEREGKQQELLTGLQSGRYLELVNQLIEASHAPHMVVTDCRLPDLAATAFKKLRKAVRGLQAEPTDADLHGIRIKAKRARYAAELAETVVGKAATRFIRRAKDFQELLGVHQDAVVGEQRIRALFAESTGRRAAFTAGRMVERQRQQRIQARAAFRSNWKKLNKRGKKAWG
ncbi:MAG: CYTH and CHAD domain-containing protein [Nitrospiraceae bacterium]